ncbi:MAG: septum formation protein Maf [Myxococcales bacterium]|nr:septum formation protein Maf [Myxococcales bacterium]
MIDPLILASASPRRRELLLRLGVPIEVRPAEVDESCHAGEAPAAYVRRVAAAKLAAIIAPDRWVLAADTTVTIDGQILGKAADAAEARSMLRLLRGRAHQVLTAFALRGPAASAAAFADVVVTEVDVVAFSEDLMEQYVACGEWRGKAGAYAIQGIGAALVAGVRGSVTNVIGLPLAEVVAQLARLGGPGPCFTQGQAE